MFDAFYGSDQFHPIKSKTVSDYIKTQSNFQKKTKTYNDGVTPELKNLLIRSKSVKHKMKAELYGL
jgi:hypothetical protein